MKCLRIHAHSLMHIAGGMRWPSNFSLPARWLSALGALIGVYWTAMCEAVAGKAAALKMWYMAVRKPVANDTIFAGTFPVISPVFSRVSLPNGRAAHVHIGEETSPPLRICFQYPVFLAGHLSAAFWCYFPHVRQCNVVLGKPATHLPLEAKNPFLQPF